ncbi:hypothetical protein BC940DRAFT_299055 [Gongronella butleri]|nr:hypothetical protein BC940DRAFT_299055 [Gongronella butleri]
MSLDVSLPHPTMEKPLPTPMPEIPADLLEALRQHSLFKRTNNELFLNKLTHLIHLRVYNAGDIIINKGEQAKAMFFLLRGQVKVCSKDHERVYATLPQGTCFGEIGILYAIPRTATVVATQKCTVATLTSEHVHQLLPQFPDVERILRFEAEERLAMLSKSPVAPSPLTSPILQHVTPPAIMRDSLQLPSPSSSSSASASSSNNASNNHRRLSIQFNVDTFAKTDIRQHLEKTPFFSGCPDEFLHMICLSIEPRRYEPSVVIFEQGERGDEMYFVIDGTVDMTTSTNMNERRGPGCYFGEESVLLNVPYAMTVKAITPLEVYVLNRFNLQQLCEMYPEMDAHLKDLAEKTRSKLQDTPPNDMPAKRELIQPQSVCTTTCDQDPTLPIDQLRQMEKKRRRPSVAVWNDPYLMNLLNKQQDVQSKQTASTLQQHHGQGQTPVRMMLDSSQFIPGDHDEEDDDNMMSPNEKRPPSMAFWDVPHTPPSDDDMHMDQHHQDKKRQENEEEMAPLARGTDENTQKAPPSRHISHLDRSIVAHIVDYLDYRSLMQFMATAKSIRSMFADDSFLHNVDFSTTHKNLNDKMFAFVIASLRPRLRSLSLAHCFHLTDAGLRALVLPPTPSPTPSATMNVPNPMDSITTPTKLKHLHSLDLNSCWLLTDQSLQLLGEMCPYLTRLNLSNCRKVTHAGMYRFLEAKQQHIDRTGRAEGIGLRWLSLSYCKNMNDLTMQHLADYCADTLQYLNLQRCTRISDNGFSSWASTSFRQFDTLILTDCSFLTDRAIDLLTMAAPTLRTLNLSFCCALSDTALTHLARLPNLSDLDLSFCGAAVSDASLAFFLQHQERDNQLTNVAPLQRLNLRGCVRLTGRGLYDILSSLPSHLLYLNVSQCPAVTNVIKQSILDLNVVDRLEV